MINAAMDNERTLNIVQLYPREMNIYGDDGNVLVLKRRAELYGFVPRVQAFELGDSTDKLRQADLIIGGGGQDSGQVSVASDLQNNTAVLHRIVADGVPGIMICGLYQLFGNRFVTSDGTKIDGVGIFDADTIGQSRRLIGNIVIDSKFGRLVGFENHSGLTYLANGQARFGTVLSGAGNNGQDGDPKFTGRSKGKIREHNIGGSEGARSNNCFGSYLHGPILPKNPFLADELLRLAAERTYGEKKIQPRNEIAKIELERLDDLARKARVIAMKRSR
jgi:CobQ-like glutamine amidotransferase family enzyme